MIAVLLRTPNMKNEKINQNKIESMIPFTVLDIPGILSYVAAYISPNIIPHITPPKTQVIIEKIYIT